ncbi:hypothetical protein L2K20_28320 [Mycobacterium sp. MBM]|nr:hypothetical protein [Mycobacterium sp. MBM]
MPLPVEIIENSDWWQPWLPFAGSALLFLGAMFTVWQTNRAADRRHIEQLATVRSEGLAGRAAERVDKFREEVSAILAERWPLSDALHVLAEAVVRYREQLKDPDIPQQESLDALNKVVAGQRLHLNRFIDLVIRASLLTNDAETLTTLKQTRETARTSWNDIKAATTGRSDALDVEHQFRSAFNSKLTELEAATRTLATSDGQPSLAVDEQRARRHWYLLWLR